MLRGWDDHGETWMGGGLEVKAILVVKDNPNPPPIPRHMYQEGGEDECKVTWTHLAEGWASGRWLLPRPGQLSSLDAPALWPPHPVLLPGVVFYLLAQQLSSQPSLHLPSFHKMFAFFFF